jgi:glycosyltransferase involved in cell wall biosynthesis
MFADLPTLTMYDGMRDGCSYYRMFSPFRLLREFGYRYDWQTFNIINRDERESIKKEVAGWQSTLIEPGRKYKIVRLMRLLFMEQENGVYSKDGLDTLISEVHGNGAIVGADFDDDMFSIPPHNPSYGDLNADMLEIFRSQIARLDFVTVTTDFLAEQTARNTGIDSNRVWVVPNLLDFSGYDNPNWNRTLPAGWLPKANNGLPRNPDNTISMRQIRQQRLGGTLERPLVIGLQGGASHYVDWQMVAQPLKNISAKYGDRVRFLIAGYHPDYLKEALGLADGQKRVWWKGWANFDQHASTVMNMDINLCPLEDDLFNRSKSPVKWLEGSAAGAASIVSPTVYGDYVTHGVDALVARTPQEWENAISFLLDNPAVRQTLARNAHVKTRNEYSLSANVFEWVNVHQEAWNALKG